MKPYVHAVNTARRHGGVPEDYLAIHDFMDSSKAHLADVRHRLLLHNTYGVWLAEQVCGEIVQTPGGKIVRTSYVTNSDGKKVQVRDVAEQHVLEDLGAIPSVSDWFANITLAQVADLAGSFRVLKRKIERLVLTQENR